MLARRHGIFGLFVALVLCGSAGAIAAPSQSDTVSQPTQDTQVRQTVQERAAQWDLSIQEWQRFQHLKQSLGRYRSDKLDPLTVLGMHARSAAERKHYARQLARMEHARVQQLLAFQKAYDNAWQSLYPNAQPVKTQSFVAALGAGQRAAVQLGLTETTRATVIVRADRCAACEKKVRQLAAAGTPMDIYVVGAASDDAIRAWARQTGLDPARVRAGDITLNHAPDAVADQLAGDALPRVIR